MKTPPRVGNFRVPWADFDPAGFSYPPCVLCGSPNYTPLAGLVINWCEFYLVQCPNCHLVWRTPLPDGGFLNDLYSERYYDVAEHAPELVYQVGIADSAPADREMRRQKSEAEAQRWINMGITPVDEDGRPRKLLEIGGGRGYLQAAARRRGWDTVGLEISPHGVKEAISRGFIMLPIPIEQLCRKYIPYPNYFDLAVLFDFLEHVTDPARVLRLVGDLLADEGIIILRIPNTIELPRLHLVDHIWHFTEETLSALLEREGFSVFEVLETGIFRSPNGDEIHNITVFAKKGD